MNNAYYSGSIKEFLEQSDAEILGILAAGHSFALEPAQRSAWQSQIEILRSQLGQWEAGWIAFEYAIPRMGKRADVVCLIEGLVFVIEFKVGASQFDRAAYDQVVDYALDLKNFHAGSHDRQIVPVVIATLADDPGFDLIWGSDGVSRPVATNGAGLGALVRKVLDQTGSQTPVDGETWTRSVYKPTPTIIEAAQALYRGHRVEDITRSDAGAKNLSLTAACLAEVIEDAKATSRKAICFVTGVPGAGKTLAGLNLATLRTKAHEDEHAVFLSGNGPLVEVLREALARDEHSQAKARGDKTKKSDAARKVNSFVQNIMHFRDDNLRTEEPPIERVAVFDEAQRAWDSKHLAKFMTQKKGQSNFVMSEPEFLISVMDRHPDWCTIICLVGGGQEINSGEAGLTEWFSALKRRFSDWKVYTSEQLTHRDYHWGHDLSAMLGGLEVHALSDLHLGVSVRSFRAEKLSDFVGAVIAGEADDARLIYQEIQANYPIVLTRSLGQARQWLRDQARGTERIGIVASSGASRLKPEGINVHEKIGAINWFLNEKMDVRSSYYLEDPATEFDIQGLELDWVGVCWDADLRAIDGRWHCLQFRGTSWQNVNSPAQQVFLKNAYRVLLTRARQGIVVYIPSGDPADPTRKPDFYSGTLEYLMACGLSVLADAPPANGKIPRGD